MLSYTPARLAMIPIELVCSHPPKSIRLRQSPVPEGVLPPGTGCFRCSGHDSKNMKGPRTQCLNTEDKWVHAAAMQPTTSNEAAKGAIGVWLSYYTVLNSSECLNSAVSSAKLDQPFF